MYWTFLVSVVCAFILSYWTCFGEVERSR